MLQVDKYAKPISFPAGKTLFFIGDPHIDRSIRSLRVFALSPTAGGTGWTLKFENRQHVDLSGNRGATVCCPAVRHLKIGTAVLLIEYQQHWNEAIVLVNEEICGVPAYYLTPDQPQYKYDPEASGIDIECDIPSLA